MPSDVEERIRSGNAGSAQLTAYYNRLYDEYHESDIIDDLINIFQSIDVLLARDILPIIEKEKNINEQNKKIQQKIINLVIWVGEKSKRFFANDKSSVIFTLGFSASGTLIPVSGAAGAGVYINPKNDITFILSIPLLLNGITSSLGLPLIMCNMEQAGLYTQLDLGFGILEPSGSIVGNAGIYKSLEDASGPYFDYGASLTLGPSIGLDITTDIRDVDRITGASFCAGIGAGFFGEAHGRWGYSGFIPLFGVGNE